MSLIFAIFGGYHFEVGMQRLFFLMLFLFFTCIAEPKAPQLMPRDVKNKVEEILKAHAAYKKISPELVERISQNFLNELDPMRGYFLESEIAEWQKPSEELMQTILDGFAKADFSAFHQVYSLLEPAIARRNQIEEEIAKQTLPKNVKGDEFKDLPFAKTRR